MTCVQWVSHRDPGKPAAPRVTMSRSMTCWPEREAISGEAEDAERDSDQAEPVTQGRGCRR